MRLEPLPGGRSAIWRRAFVLGLLCLALAAAAASDELHAALLEVIAAGEALIRAHPGAGAALFVVFAAISAMLAFVSIAVIVPVAVYTWGQPVSLLLLWAGWILGGCAAYCIARFLGRPVVRWFTADTALRRLEAHVHPETHFGLIFLFQLALPSEIPGYLLGLVRYPVGRYLLALGLAELPYAAATIFLGASFLERRSGAVLGMGLLLVLASVLAFRYLRDRLADKSKPARRA